MSAGTRRSISGTLAVALAALSWGTVGVVGQHIQRGSGLQPEHIAFFRLAIAGVCLAPFLLHRPRVARHRPGRRDWPLIGVGLSLALNQLFYFLAIDEIGVAAAALLTLGLSPVIAKLFEIGIDRAAPTRTAVAALGSALLGLTLLSDVGSLGAANAAGILFSVVSATCFALVALSRRRATGVSASQSTAATIAIAALVLLPVAIATHATVSLSAWDVVGLGYVGIGATAVAYLLYFRGLVTVRASVALVVVLVEPLTASLLGVLVEGERLGGGQLVGAAVLLGAVLLVAAGRTAPAASRQAIAMRPDRLVGKEQADGPPRTR